MCFGGQRHCHVSHTMPLILSVEGVPPKPGIFVIVRVSKYVLFFNCYTVWATLDTLRVFEMVFL